MFNLKDKKVMLYEDTSISRCVYRHQSHKQARSFHSHARSSLNTDHCNQSHVSLLLLVAIVSATISGIVTSVICIYFCRIVTSHELMNVLQDQKSALMRMQVRQLLQEQQYDLKTTSNAETMAQKEHFDNFREDSNSKNVGDLATSVNNKQNFVRIVSRGKSSYKNWNVTVASLNQLSTLNIDQRDMNNFHIASLSEEHLTTKVRVRRNVHRKEKSDLNMEKVTTSMHRGTTQRLPSSKLQKKSISSFIHLELDIRDLDPTIIAKLTNGSSHKLEFGTIYKTSTNLGFITNHENGLIRNWRQPNWSEKYSKHCFMYSEQEGEVSVLKEGLYFVYAQIRYYQKNLSGFEVRLNRDGGLLKCLEGTESEHRWRYNTCYVGAVKRLKQGDKLRMLDLYAKTSTAALNPHYIHIGEDVVESNYWGAFRFG